MSYQDGQDRPANTGIFIADVLAAIYAGFSVSAALVHRQKTGAGQHIDVTLAESMFSLLVFELQNAQFPLPGDGRCTNRRAQRTVLSSLLPSATTISTTCSSPLATRNGKTTRVFLLQQRASNNGTKCFPWSRHGPWPARPGNASDRKSTRLNSSH